MIERSHLAIISALARHGTLTRAADELCLTQSALSHMMRKLESKLECSLWRREGKRLQLTEAGNTLRRTADRVLPELERTERLLSDYARGTRGHLRIGVECHPCYQWLLGVIEGYLEAWPQVEVDVTERFQFSGIEALAHHQIDLLLTPDPVALPELTWERVHRYELLLLVADSHRLAGRTTAAPRDLADEILLTYPVSRERLDVFGRFLTPEGIEPAEHRHVETTEVMLQLVAAGRGVTTLPDYIVEKYCRELHVRTLRLGAEGMQNALYLAHRNEDSGLDYLRDFAAAHRVAV
ncbi:MAG: LysR substrate-binding domain-containing protein [Spirochaetia bacterium]